MPRANRHFLPGHVWRIQARPVPIVPRVCPESNRRVQPLSFDLASQRSGQALRFKTLKELRVKAVHRAVERADGTSVPQERSEAYGDEFAMKITG